MTKRIDRLTDKQIARMPEWVDRWTAIGLSTAPADFDAAFDAALKCYDLCRLKRPRNLVKAASPVGAHWGGALMASPANVGSNVWSNVESNVELNVESNVGANVWSNVGSNVESNVESNVGSNVWSNVGSNVESNVGSNVWSNVGSNVRAGINNYRSGQFWAGWLSYVTFFRDVCGWQDDTLAAFALDEQLGLNCGWVWWHEDVLAISDRPEVIRLDDARRLHGETGPAIRYRDGWSIYAWHGTTVPEAWIENKKALDAKTALTWSNIEQRRAACEIVGWDRILSELNANVIDDDGDPEIGALVEVNLPDIGRERFLRVRCGTGRHFALPVPREMKTALEAQSWTWGLDKTEFRKPEIRT